MNPTESQLVERQTDIDTALGRLSMIRWTDVKRKLVDAVEGKGWTQQKADTIEIEYRQFLALTYGYPEMSIVPSRDVDAFWHQHILDTRAYAADTAAVFGYFLHHFPYFGMGSKEEKELLGECFEETLRLRSRHFGGSIRDFDDAAASCRGASQCSSCKGGR